MGLLVGPAGRTSWTNQLDGPAGRTSWTDQLDGPAGQTSWTYQLVGPAGRTSWTDQLDRPVLFIWSLGQFAYSKIFLSVCTLSQLPSPTKALFLFFSDDSPQWGNENISFVFSSSSGGIPITGELLQIWVKISSEKNCSKFGSISHIWRNFCCPKHVFL